MIIRMVFPTTICPLVRDVLVCQLGEIRCLRRKLSMLESVHGSQLNVLAHLLRCQKRRVEKKNVAKKVNARQAKVVFCLVHHGSNTSLSGCQAFIYLIHKGEML